MFQRLYRAMAAGTCVPLLLLAGAASALAHGKGGPGLAPVQGMVTAVDVARGNLQVQTQTGGVTFTLTSGTHVIREVSGSTTDLHANQQVDAHLIKNGTTIDSIRIEAPPLPHGRPDAGKQPPSGKPTPTWHASGPDHHQFHGPPSEASGQVVTASSGSISILDHHTGKTTTYALSGSVHITKVINGTLKDLAVNETVRVYRGHNNDAVGVTILNA